MPTPPHLCHPETGILGMPYTRQLSLKGPHLCHHAWRRTVVRTEYLPAMRRLLPAPLAHADESGEPMAAIATVVSLMDEYGIGRDQFDYILDVTNFKASRLLHACA
eukprot:365682-Chlamydomonas_euryale.AAC.28